LWLLVGVGVAVM